MLTMAPASVWKSLENWVYPGAWVYTEAERKMGNFVVLTDDVAIPIFVAIYLTLHSGLSVAGTGSEEASLCVIFGFGGLSCLDQNRR
ncbi:hypothetical protein DIPPA_10470 [Diplonema papillatum]|nr:hypothetical protein DIPPA_10478 [Diplonema papillatum]KAJ9462579.1 hypothetical protein DIPPA_10470 [Diplonema papillatum]